jgi:hypothetical protein
MLKGMKSAKYLLEINKIPVENRVYLDESGIDRFLHKDYGRSKESKLFVR